jgi:hypothetical protein
MCLCVCACVRVCARTVFKRCEDTASLLVNCSVRSRMNYTTYIIKDSGYLSRYNDGLRVGRPGFDSRHGKLFFFSKASRPALGPTQSPILWVPEAIFSGVKRPGSEGDHFLPCSAEVKNIGAILPLPNMFLLHSV